MILSEVAKSKTIKSLNAIKMKLNTLHLLLVIFGLTVCSALKAQDKDDVILKPKEFDVFAECCVDVNALVRDTTRLYKETVNLKKQIKNKDEQSDLDSTAIDAKDKALVACEKNQNTLQEKLTKEEGKSKRRGKAAITFAGTTALFILAEIIRFKVL